MLLDKHSIPFRWIFLLKTKEFKYDGLEENKTEDEIS